VRGRRGKEKEATPGQGRRELDDPMTQGGSSVWIVPRPHGSGSHFFGAVRVERGERGKGKGEEKKDERKMKEKRNREAVDQAGTPARQPDLGAKPRIHRHAAIHPPSSKQRTTSRSERRRTTRSAPTTTTPATSTSEF
jgi:hypothetical protein